MNFHHPVPMCGLSRLPSSLFLSLPKSHSSLAFLANPSFSLSWVELIHSVLGSNLCMYRFINEKHFMSVYFLWEINSFEGRYSDLLIIWYILNFYKNFYKMPDGLNHSYYNGSTYHKAWLWDLLALLSQTRPCIISNNVLNQFVLKSIGFLFLKQFTF